MAKINRKQIALIHVAKNKLGLDEAAYRELLGQFGAKSSKELDYAQFKELIAAMERLGFEASTKFQAETHLQKPIHPLPGEVPNRRGFLNEKQAKKIWALWHRVSRAPVEKREAALNQFCKNKVKIDCWRWLSYAAAQKMIVILEAMARQ